MELLNFTDLVNHGLRFGKHSSVIRNPVSLVIPSYSKIIHAQAPILQRPQGNSEEVDAVCVPELPEQHTAFLSSWLLSTGVRIL